MVNSHYVPQFILRHFADNERIHYYDIEKKISEVRNIKSIFSEKGYYPESLEENLCHKAEVQFANLLNKKILKERYRIVLSPEELFVVKKYLIVTTIRFNFVKAMRKINNNEEVIKSYSESFYSNINKVLECIDLNQMTELMVEILGNDPALVLQRISDMDGYGEMKLFADIKNILHSYIVLVSTNRSQEDIIISDTGFSYKASHTNLLSDENFDKCFYTLNYAMRTGNPSLLYITKLLTPYDYIFCPISKNLAIMSLSVFYKFFNNKSDIYGLLPVKGMTVESLLGFGNLDLVEPPKVKQKFGKAVSYEYSIKELAKSDVLRINSSIINGAEHHLGYNSFDKIKRSIEYYNDLSDNERRHELALLDSWE